MIERLATPVSEADLRSLALLLVDAVESGAAVSFTSVGARLDLVSHLFFFGLPIAWAAARYLAPAKQS